VVVVPYYSGTPPPSDQQYFTLVMFKRTMDKPNGSTRVRSGRCCSPRHSMPFESRDQGLKRVCLGFSSLACRAMGLADIARHVIGCRLTLETRVQNA
jgi:hypothetical protein